MGILAAIGGFLLHHAFAIGMTAMAVGSTVYGVVSTEQQKAESRRLEAKSDQMYADQNAVLAAQNAKNTADLKNIINGNYNADNDSYLALKASAAYTNRRQQNATFSYGQTKR